MADPEWGDVEGSKMAIFRCTSCTRIFSSTESLVTHVDLVHKSGDRKSFDCDRCGRSMASKASLENHIRCVHDQARTFRCDHCPKSFGTKKILARHVKTVHTFVKVNMSVPTNTCHECHKEFSSPSALRDHRISAHTSEKPYKCDICKRFYPIKKSLTRHLRNVHAVHKTEACEACDQVFSSSKSLEDHPCKFDSSELSAVTPHNVVECTVCGELFPTVDGLARHKSTAHWEDYVPDLLLDNSRVKVEHGHARCHECNLEFDAEAELDAHVRKMHMQYHCYECNVSFGQPESLQEHVAATHTNYNYNNPRQRTTVSGSQAQDQSAMVMEAMANGGGHPSADPNDSDDRDSDAANGGKEKYALRKRDPAGHLGWIEDSDSAADEGLDDDAVLRKSPVKKAKRAATKDPYECPYCDATFAMRRSLPRHILRFHADVKGRTDAGRKAIEPVDGQLKCPYCPTVVTAERSMEHHIVRFHKRMYPLHYDALANGETSDGEDADDGARTRSDDNGASSDGLDSLSDARHGPQRAGLGDGSGPSEDGLRAPTDGSQPSPADTGNRSTPRGDMVEVKADADGVMAGGGSNTSDVLRQHRIDKTRKRRRHPCGRCSCSFDLADSLLDHVKACHPDEPVHKCPHCDVEAATGDALGRHVRALHAARTDRRRNVCVPCNLTFRRKKNLVAHLRRDHPYPQKCDRCGTVCNTPDDLTGHMVSVHEVTIKQYCRICDKGFYLQRDYYEHNNTVHYDKDRRPFCMHCQKRFKALEQLAVHISQVHEKRRDFMCEICSKSFGRLPVLKEHVRLMHEANPVRFMCDRCDKTFTTRSNLSVHIKIIHEKRKDHVCSVCNEAFSLQCQLKIHVRYVHEGGAEMTCDICSKVFSNKKVMLLHKKRIHEKVKDVECDKCAKMFSTHDDLKQHYKFFHKLVYKRPKILIGVVDNDEARPGPGDAGY